MPEVVRIITTPDAVVRLAANPGPPGTPGTNGADGWSPAPVLSNTYPITARTPAVRFPVGYPVEVSTITVAAGRSVGQFFDLDRSITISDLYLTVTTAGSGPQMTRMGLYRLNQTTLATEALVASPAAVSVGSLGLKTAAITTPVTIQAGRYYLRLINGAGNSVTFGMAHFVGARGPGTSMQVVTNNFRFTNTFGDDTNDQSGEVAGVMSPTPNLFGASTTVAAAPGFPIMMNYTDVPA
jgi:hypothetical protein